MTAAVREILLREWDPIGVENAPLAQDEYDSYIPVICRMIIEKRGISELADHLSELTTVNMGLTTNDDACKKVAESLVKLADAGDHDV
jgi:hypothetical protein